MNTKINIIGAGISGLALGAFCEKYGIDYHIYEKYDRLNPIGGGLTIWSNAAKCLDYLGIKDNLYKYGSIIEYMNVVDLKGNLLDKRDIGQISRKHTSESYCLSRGDLIEALYSKISPSKLSLDSQITAIDKFQNEIVVYSDGINSLANQHIFTNKSVSYTGYYCFRGFFNSNYCNTGNAYFSMGKGAQVGAFPCGKNKVYWFVCLNYPTPNMKHSDLYNKFFRFYTDNQLFLQKVNNYNGLNYDDILVHPVLRADKFSKWYNVNSIAIGDAAHPSTPSLGQGACLGIEDAFVLANLFNKYGVNVSVFPIFQKLRTNRANTIVKFAEFLGKVYQFESKSLDIIRNLSFKLPISGSIAIKTLDKILNFDTDKIIEEIS